jgi:gas vesicle protein
MATSSEEPRQRLPLDGVFVFVGMILGGVLGGIVTLLFAPMRGVDARDSIVAITQQAKERIESVGPTDPVEESLAVGKAAARRRREQLGLPPTDD